MPPKPLSESEVHALMRAEHGDPFAVLGPHETRDGLLVRALMPGAQGVAVVHSRTGWPLAMLARHEGSDLFTGLVPAAEARLGYSFQIDWGSHSSRLEDPYRFAFVLGETDVWLLAEGTHLRPWERLGAHLREIDGVKGVAFAVWAPNARRVSVVGDFNNWDGRRHMMRLRRECGVWEIFAPHVAMGDAYEFEILSAQGEVLRKADPFAFSSRLRPETACVVAPLPAPVAMPEARARANGRDAPLSIYEVHLGSWRRKRDGQDWLDYRELAETLVPYARDMGFTHIELLPVSEHPFDGSWGYQPIGLYAPTSRFGTPGDFRHFVEAAHAAGLGVILDWVPAHFPTDAHGLGRFDGTALYEYADPREGFHNDWQTLIFNYARTEVRNYLVGNALYWLERYGVDGLRVDAVASMLYRDYSRKAGEWVPNAQGGRENLEAIDFLRRMNRVVGVERPGAVTIAEESTSFPGVTRPPEGGGLGFHYKWNMGWMNDTLAYAGTDPVYRKHHHKQITFGLMYAHSENFVLPLSHDEVVHGKGSMIGRMPGDEWQKFAGLRNLYGYLWGYPGKKLLFMGGEFAQVAEWNADRSLDWHLLEHALHQGVRRLVRDLNNVYRHFPALHEMDNEAAGFEWIVHDDADQSVFAFVRRARDGAFVVVACNFTPLPRHGYRLGVPCAGAYREIINTDGSVYGGSGVGNGVIESSAVGWHGKADSMAVSLPPLGTVMWVLA